MERRQFCKSTPKEVVSCIQDRFNQPGYRVLKNRGDLLLKAVRNEDCCYFFIYVSNLHFPPMKMASEKPLEAVLERVIFLGEHAPRPP